MRKERKDNPELKRMILDKLAEVEYTHTYAFGIRENKMIKAVIVENADEVLPLITVAERQAESHGAVWGVRVNLKKANAEILKTYAREIIDICSIEYLESEYAVNGNRGGNNRGHIFERLCAEVLGGKQNENPTAKCVDCGDIIINGEHIQCKYCNATVTTEPQVNRFYKRYLEKNS